jgi:hypothetical protein
VRASSFLTGIVLAGLWVVGQEPVLSSASLYDLHDSADRVKSTLQLSSDEFASLQHALDVMVGEPARELVEEMESSSATIPAAERRASEAKVLAPIDGMTFEALVTAATEKRIDERTGLLGDLRLEQVAAPTSRRQLHRIDVVRAAYWSSVATGERAVDFTIRNGSDRAIDALLLDCRLIDTTRRATRERGTCRIEFDGGLMPGMAATASAPVSWESRQRLGWIVEARPIRAYGAGGEALWEVPSEHDPREAGRIAQLQSRIAEVDSDLRTLRVDRIVAR